MKQLTVSCFVLFLTLKDEMMCERILLLPQVPLFSHQSVIKGLSLALHKRGHEIVIPTSFPTKNLSLVNYREIDFSSSIQLLNNLNVIQQLPNLGTHWESKIINFFNSYSYAYTRYFYDHPEIRKIYEEGSKKKFDLVIAEAVPHHGIFFIAHKLKAPLISILTLDLHIKHHHILGSPLLSSHESNWEVHVHTNPEVSFWTRVQNFLRALYIVRTWYTFEEGTLENLVKEYLGNDIPSFSDVMRNISLYLVNQDPLLSYSRPMPPNVILFSGIHIMKNPPPLSKRVSEFLAKGTNGFIYMSLGATVNFTMLPPKIVTAIFNVFSRLPYRVLCKLDADNSTVEQRNIITTKWVSQQSVLAHPNIKLFIYQGGMQSTDETIHYGVPIVGIPLLPDQMFRITKLVSLGVGRMLDYTRLDEEIFQEAVIDVLSNKSYKTKMLELRKLTKDKPYDSKDHAVWWVEYVMRHKGAPHLRFSGADDSWYRRYDMDVVAFLLIISFIVILICVTIFVLILLCCCTHINSSKHPSIEQKQNKVE